MERLQTLLTACLGEGGRAAGSQLVTLQLLGQMAGENQPDGRLHRAE